MAQSLNYAAVIRATGDHKGQLNLDDTGSQKEGAHNEALLGDGNVTIGAKGGSINTNAAEDPATIELKAKLMELLPKTPLTRINDLMKDLEDLGIYNVDDLPEIADMPERIKSVKDVLKKKFIEAVKKLKEEPTDQMNLC